MSGTPRILFVADAGEKIGGGHVMRCLTLAEAVTRAGAAAIFAATPSAAAVLGVFARAPIELVPLSDELSAAELAAAAVAAAKAARASAIVADHYGFGPAEDAALAAASPRLLIIDDLRRRHAGAIVLDPAVGRGTRDYPGCELMAGPQFALVRAEFAARRDQALARRAQGRPPARVLVALGLTDAGAITARVVGALLPALGDAVLDVVMGDVAPSRAEIEALAAADPRVAAHIDARDMARLTAEADIGVGAGGSSVWERCVLGLPSLTVVVADNQRDNAVALEAAGAAVAVAPPSGDFDQRLRAAFERLMADPLLRTAMSRSAADLCDGMGADRVAQRLLA
jgi:UDP-2,4-diacetamido-2,4,6-trideoxy-beta-L-altropyranose hydrolase